MSDFPRDQNSEIFVRERLAGQKWTDSTSRKKQKKQRKQNIRSPHETYEDMNKLMANVMWESNHHAAKQRNQTQLNHQINKQ